MSLEQFTPKDLHNITTLANAIRARSVYEEARLNGTGRGQVLVRSSERAVVADEQIAQIWRGMEVGARTELFDAGHHVAVHEIYDRANRKELASGE